MKCSVLSDGSNVIFLVLIAVVSLPDMLFT